MKIPFKSKLSNKHVIDNSQVMLSVVQNGPSNEKFNFSYGNRQNENLNKDLCKAIVELASVIPNGIVVFFPSNALMDGILISMRKYDCMNKLMGLKHFHS